MAILISPGQRAREILFLAGGAAFVLLVFGEDVVDVGDGFHAFEFAEFDGIQLQDGVVGHFWDQRHDVVPAGGVHSLDGGEFDAVLDAADAGVVGGQGEFGPLEGIVGMPSVGIVEALQIQRTYPHALDGIGDIVRTQPFGRCGHHLHEPCGTPVRAHVVIEFGFVVDDGRDQPPVQAGGI